MPNDDYEAIVWVTVNGKTKMMSGMSTHNLSSALLYLDEISKVYPIPDAAESGFVAIYNEKIELRRIALHKVAKAAAC